MKRVLVVDNYDSFTYNLVDAFARTGARTEAVRNDQATTASVEAGGFDAVVLSPGPGHPGNPRDFGVCGELIRSGTSLPLFGVCLGMQGLAHHTGGRVVRAPHAVHGEASRIDLTDHPLFSGLNGRMEAGRYHSLVVEEATLPETWDVIGHGDGLPMAMAHRGKPWIGVQFHPESILTPEGPRLVRNFLEAFA